MNRSMPRFASIGLAATLLAGCSAEGLAEDSFQEDSALEDTGGAFSEENSGHEMVRDDQDDRTAGPFAAYSLYVDPDSDARDQAYTWRSWKAGSDLMYMLADTSVSLWVGDWNSDPAETVDEALDDSRDAGSNKLRSLVVYNIPHRDCGAWSAGGADDAGEYYWFISEVARGIGGRKVIVILEPDALGLMSCLSSSQQVERKNLMYWAVTTLKNAGASVYIDAGDSNWLSARDMSSLLWATGLSNAAGFALNVSHTETTADSIGYANELRAIVGTNAHYVVDTGRSGNGPTSDNQWCNPRGRAIGDFPTLNTYVDGADAYLWVKPPGYSDGYCNGGPAAGDWWADYAYELALLR